MKKFFSLLLTLLVLVWAHVTFAAQDFPAKVRGYAPPSGPPVPLMVPVPVGAMPCPPGPCMPCPPPCPPPCKPDPTCLVTFYGGYVFDLGKGQGFKYRREPENGGGRPERTVEAPLQGLWASLSAGSVPKLGFGAQGSASILVPKDDNGELREDGRVVVDSTLRSRLEWGSVEGAATYGLFGDPCTGVLQALGGLRWDRISASQRFSHRDPTNTLFSRGTNNFTINAWLPYAGAQFNQLSQVARLTAGIIGFPWILGNAKFQDTSIDTEILGPGVAPITLHGGEFDHQLTNGFFVELFADYARTVGDTVFLGAFVKANFLGVRTNFGGTSQVVLPLVSAQERVVFERSTLTVGGSIGLAF